MVYSEFLSQVRGDIGIEVLIFLITLEQQHGAVHDATRFHIFPSQEIQTVNNAKMK